MARYGLPARPEIATAGERHRDMRPRLRWLMPIIHVFKTAFFTPDSRCACHSETSYPGHNG